MSPFAISVRAVVASAALLAHAFAAESPVPASAPAAAASSAQAARSAPVARTGPVSASRDRKRLAAEQQRRKEEAGKEALREAEVHRLEAAFDRAMSAQAFDEASGLLASLREQLPDTRIGVMRRMAWLHQAQGDTAAARTWLERVIARLPNDLNAQLNLALIDAQEGRLPLALERVRALKFHHPSSPTLDHVLSRLERG